MSGGFGKCTYTCQLLSCHSGKLDVPSTPSLNLLSQCSNKHLKRCLIPFKKGQGERDLNFKTFVFHLSDWQLSELLRVFETNPFILWDVSTTQKSHFRRQLSSVSEKTPVHPTPVLLPGESQGQGSLVGCSPWGR